MHERASKSSNGWQLSGLPGAEFVVILGPLACRRDGLLS